MKNMQLLRIIKMKKKKIQVIKHMDKFVLKLKVHLYSLCLIKTYNFTDQSETKQSDDSKTRYK